MLIDRIKASIQRGDVPCELERVQAATWHDYSVRDGWKHFPRRPGESATEFTIREKCYTYLAAYAVEQLTAAIYGLPPIRVYSDGFAWLSDADAAVRLDDVMTQAHWAAIVGGVAAVHVELVDSDRYTMHLYRRHEITLWPSRDPQTPQALATHGFTDDGRRITQLWTADDVTTYLSNDDFLTAHAHQPHVLPTTMYSTGSVRHGLGRIPFFLVHARFPVSTTWVNGIGQALANLNRVMDIMATDTHQSHGEVAIPIAVATNVTPNQTLSRAPGTINILVRTGTGELYNQDNPKIDYFAPTVSLTELEAYAVAKANRILSEIGVDPAIINHVNAYTSGAAIVSRLAAQSQYRRATTSLASHWELLRLQTIAQLANSPFTPNDLRLEWPELRPAAWVPELQVVDSNDVALGTRSVPDILEQRLGISHQDAIARAQRVKDEQSQLNPPQPNINPNTSGSLPTQ